MAGPRLGGGTVRDTGPAGRVRAEVPADRLLVYEVTQGWEPLCAFLGVPVPDEPFPSASPPR